MRKKASTKQLLDRVRRDDGPLRVPSVIGEGITASPDSVWAWVILPTRSTDDLNTDRLFRLTIDGASALRRLLPRDSECQFKILWGRHRGQPYVEQEMASFDGELSEGQRAYIELGGQRIDDNAFPDRKVLLGVELPLDKGPELPAQLRRSTRKVAGEAAEREDAAHLLARAAKTARDWHERMAASTFRARPATVRELAWALRRDLRRTVGWLPESAVASGGQVARLLNGSYVVPQADHLEIDTDTGTRYLRCLTVSQTGFPATEMSLPGGEWLKELTIPDDLDDARPEPVEVSIRFRNVSPTVAAKRMREALALAKEQGREAAQGVAEEPPEEVMESRDILPTRLAEVRRGTVSMVEDNVVWVVEADSKTALDKRTWGVIDHYGAQGIELWIPKHVQHVLWMETVLHDRLRFSDTEQFRPMTTLVGGWFHGGSEIGDATGPLLGANIGSTPGPFRMRLTNAQLENEPVTTVFVGRSRAGKSTALMLAVLGELNYKCWALLTDDKGDLEGICRVAGRFGIPVTRVNTSEQASGAMDPFRYVDDPVEAASRVVDNLLVMLPASMAEHAESVIRQYALIVADYEHPENRSTNAVIRLLASATTVVEEEPEDGREPRVAPDVAARRIGAELLGLARDPLARPLIGMPDLDAPGLPTGPGLVYMRYQDLRMPDRTTPRSAWKPGERLSVALKQASFDYATYTAHKVQGIPKLVALTELHLVTGFDFGRGFVGRIARMGAALDVNLLLDTQAVAELVSIDGLIDQVSAVFAFRVDTDAEADAQAQLLGLTPEPVVRARQQSWMPGECEARDRHRRIGPVQFDYLDAGIAELLNTTPKRGRAPSEDPLAETDPDTLLPADEFDGEYEDVLA